MAQTILIVLLVAAASLIAGSSAAANVICAEVYQPVCGEDGVTYSNACKASMNKVHIAHQGACKVELLVRPTAGRPCLCKRLDIFPVCGSDGKTYNSRCQAKCAGVMLFTSGRCPDV